MAYENLLKSVEESAQEKERELLEQAKKQAEDIRLSAQKQAKELQELAIKDAEMSAAAERNKQLYLAKGKIKETLLSNRERAFLAAVEMAGRRLKSFRENASYPAIFRRLTEEAVAAIGSGPFVIHIDKRDLALCTATLAAMQLSCGIVPDLDCMGGLTVSSPDGRVTISNTFESRLERVREHKRLEIHAILSGG